MNEVDHFNERIKQVVWSSDFFLDTNNFNYSIDPSQYNLLTSSQSVTMYRVSGEIGKPIYNDEFISDLKCLKNPYADKIITSLLVKNAPFSSRWFDESVVLFLQYPSAFSYDTISISDVFCRISPDEVAGIEQKVMDILTGSTVNQNQVLLKFPIDSTEYQDDVRLIVNETLGKYGKDEWIACVLANELHRHLGVYTIVGVKMGMRVREYFGAGVDEMEVISYAGMKPPYSCMNDGLQVSTGATLGHGSIQIDSDSIRLPKADFIYMGQTISVSLKDDYRLKIESQVGELNDIYGLESDIYWALVRKIAIYYWEEWDRNTMFQIQKVN
jgi:pyrimidine-specific ribonucleoside hydrolase